MIYIWNVHKIIIFIVVLIITTIGILTVCKIKKKRILKTLTRWLILTLLLGFTLFKLNYFGEKVNWETRDSQKFTLKQVQQDFKKIEKAIMEKNPKIFADEEELKQMFSDGYDKLYDDMTELDFYKLVTPIIAEVKCGHTFLTVSKAYDLFMNYNAKYLPFEITVIDNKIYITKDNSSNNIEKGTEIISINSKSSNQIIDDILPHLTSDGENLTRNYHFINRWFPSLYYQFVDDSEDFTIEYKTKNEEIKETTVKAMANPSYAVTGREMLYEAQIDGESYNKSIYEDYAILDISTFVPRNKNDYKEYKNFVDTFFKEVNEKRINKVILDLRGNFGGIPEPAVYLLSYLTNKPFDYFKGHIPFFFRSIKDGVIPKKNIYEGKLITLVDGACFSTTGHLVSLLKYHNIGTIIGEETSGSYICTDSARSLVLNNTKIRLHYSTEPYEVAVEGFELGKGITPDIKISPTLEDVLVPSDKVLDYAINN